MTRKPLLHTDVRDDGHGNAHRYGGRVGGEVVAAPLTGTPLDLLGLRRIRAVVNGAEVTASGGGSLPIGTKVTAIPHIINGKVWSFTAWQVA